MTTVIIKWDQGAWIAFNDDLEVLAEGEVTSDYPLRYSDIKKDAYRSGVKVGASVYHDDVHNVTFCRAVLVDA